MEKELNTIQLEKLAVESSNIFLFILEKLPVMHKYKYI